MLAQPKLISYNTSLRKFTKMLDMPQWVHLCIINIRLQNATLCFTGCEIQL